MTALCYECWAHIVDFYKFQQTVEFAQLKYDKARSKNKLKSPPEQSDHVNSSYNEHIKDELPEQEEIIIDDEERNDSLADELDEDALDQQLVDELEEEMNEETLLTELLTEGKGDIKSLSTQHFLDNTDIIDEQDPNQSGLRTKSKRNIRPTAKKLELDAAVHSRSTSKFVVNSERNLALKEIPKIRISLNSENNVQNCSISEASNPSSEVNNTPPTSDSNSNRKFSKHTAAKVLDDLIAKLKPELPCEICSELCPSFTLLKYHFHTEHPDDDFYINCCNRRFTIRSRFEEHLRLHSDDPLKCEGCGKCFKWRLTLNRHCRSCPPYQLVKDGKAKPVPKYEEVNKGRIYKCKLCSKAYTRRFTLHVHMATHTGTALQFCPHCPQSFIYRRAILEHIKKEHPGLPMAEPNRKGKKRSQIANRSIPTDK